jgi:transcriptional regulator with XRE-family HTH domain
MRFLNRIDNTKTAKRLRDAITKQGVSQADIAVNAGLNQSQISRLLSGQFQRRTKGLNALCIYLKVEPVTHTVALSLSKYPDLSSCLSEVLDGSRQRERAVVLLLRSARKLG